MLVSCDLFVGREVETRVRGRRVIMVLEIYRIGPMPSWMAAAIAREPEQAQGPTEGRESDESDGGE